MTKYPSKLIDEYRDVNVDHHWWEFTYDMWQERLARFGIDVEKENMKFSGFWSQGDGACFTGTVDNDERFITFMTGGTKAYPLWRKASQVSCLSLVIRIESTCSRYCHENTVDVSVEFDQFQRMRGYDQGEELLWEMHRVWDNTMEAEYGDFLRDCRDFVRALCRYFYKDLQAEYEYLTSDEAVSEWIEANVDPEDIAAAIADANA